jgi:2-keto-4-pentenoate hydratase/2-oxohepta-3-ene-1,7-dioic acid hydratase in catechol pathway
MLADSYVQYGAGGVGLLTAAGELLDVCSVMHPEQAIGPGHDADRCLIRACLQHSENADAILRTGRQIATADLRIPIARPVNVFGAPVNYYEHRGELGAVRSSGGATTRELGLFVKASGSISGPADPIELPDMPDREFHYEGEIAIVMGRECFDIDPADADAFIAGFTGALDITLRLEADRREERSMRKSYKTFTPIGPGVLPLSAVPDIPSMTVDLEVNGSPRQHGCLRDLIVDVPELVAMASSVVVLHPGDLILSGTPAGVGPLEPGDSVRLVVSGLPPLELGVVRRVGA